VAESSFIYFGTVALECVSDVRDVGCRFCLVEYGQLAVQLFLLKGQTMKRYVIQASEANEYVNLILKPNTQWDWNVCGFCEATIFTKRQCEVFLETNPPYIFGSLKMKEIKCLTK